MQYGNIVARSRNHCCNVNAPLRSVCATDVQSIVNNTILSVEQKCFNDEFMSSTTLKHSEVFHVNTIVRF
jgi:hypothetical protein